jgi:hypothetical protein
MTSTPKKRLDVPEGPEMRKFVNLVCFLELRFQSGSDMPDLPEAGVYIPSTPCKQLQFHATRTCGACVDMILFADLLLHLASFGQITLH